MTEHTKPPRRGRLWWLVALGLASGLGGWLVLAGSWESAPPPTPLPSPNGYDDLVQAGTLVQGDWPNQGNMATASLAELVPFVLANQAVIDRARLGLSRECLVPVENSQAWLSRHYADISRVRGVARLLIGEGRVREANGRLSEASQSYRALLKLGQAMTQGGSGIDVSTGWVIQNQAMEAIRKLRDRLPSQECRAIIADLFELERRRVTLKELGARHDAWYRGAYSPVQRTMMTWTGMARKGRQAELGMVQATLTRVERTIRFAVVEFAIHAYHEDKKSWPRSVGDLVPRYLPAVPIDPSTGKPLDYPANPSGELTDDLNAIARPDGEVTPGR